MPTPYFYYGEKGSTAVSTIDGQYSAWMNLGYIPTKGKYQDVSSFLNLPPVWQICENLDSQNTYNFVPTSSTYPTRGVKSSVSGCTKYRTRGSAPDIVLFMNKFYDQSAVQYVSSIISSSISEWQYSSSGDLSSVYKAYTASSYWFDFLNSSSTQVVSGVSSFDVYENFRFGRGIHKLFKYYNNVYGAQDLTNAVLEDKTKTGLFSMIYGPGLLNNDLSVPGSGLDVSGNFLASSFVFPGPLLSTSGGSIF